MNLVLLKRCETCDLPLGHLHPQGPPSAKLCHAQFSHIERIACLERGIVRLTHTIQGMALELARWADTSMQTMNELKAARTELNELNGASCRRGRTLGHPPCGVCIPCIQTENRRLSTARDL